MRCACILLAVTIGASAQSIAESEVARAKRLLASPQWIEKAWGAYFAGGLYAQELQQPLIDALREAAPLRDAKFQTEEYAYVAALFDAAIQSGITVPPEVLEPFGEIWRNPKIILVARNGSEEGLLQMRAQELTSAQWIAVNNVLLQHRSSRFFPLVLGEVEISHTFILKDPGDGSGTGGGAGGATCVDGGAQMPKGFPPIGLYDLLTSAHPGDVRLASGPENAYFRRWIVPTSGPVGIGLCDPEVDRETMRIEYLAEWNNLTQEQGEELFRPETRLASPQEIEPALRAQEDAIRTFAQKAGGANGVALRILVKVDDERRSAHTPIPSIAPREFTLE